MRSTNESDKRLASFCQLEFSKQGRKTFFLINDKWVSVYDLDFEYSFDRLMVCYRKCRSIYQAMYDGDPESKLGYLFRNLQEGILTGSAQLAHSRTIDFVEWYFSAFPLIENGAALKEIG